MVGGEGGLEEVVNEASGTLEWHALCTVAEVSERAQNWLSPFTILSSSAFLVVASSTVFVRGMPGVTGRLESIPS